jgi:hypothetical protein
MPIARRRSKGSPWPVFACRAAVGTTSVCRRLAALTPCPHNCR